MVLPVGAEYHDQRLIRVRRTESGYDTEELTWVRFVPLVAGLPRPGSETAEASGYDDFVSERFAIE